MTRMLFGFGFAIAGAVLASSTGQCLAQQAAGSAPGAGSPVKVKIPAGVVAKANAVTPPAKATKKTSVGKGKATVNTANAADDMGTDLGRSAHCAHLAAATARAGPLHRRAGADRALQGVGRSDR